MRFEVWFDEQSKMWGQGWDPSGLDTRFLEYFESGKRIAVRWLGDWKRGVVGVTTGRKPIFILLPRRDSKYSGITLTANTVDAISEEGRGHPSRDEGDGYRRG